MDTVGRIASSSSACSVLACLLLGSCAIGEEVSVATHVRDWRDEVIYQVVVDRFENGDTDNDWQGEVGPVPGDLARFQGGDWLGLTSRLDYIRGLGATALWISPVVANVERTGYQDGYHGYWAADFTAPNPRFGTLDELRELVAQAHARDMKVIVDVVTNHTGRVFFYDLDGDGQVDDGEQEPVFSGSGPYPAPVVWLGERPSVFRQIGDEVAVTALGEEHFHRRGRISSHGNAAQKELGDFPTGLRDLDTESEEVLQALVDTYVHWVELTDVDGYRLDAVPHVPHEFWLEFSYRMRERLDAIGKQRFLLLGEVFTADPTVLSGYTSTGGLDSVFDFSLKRELIDAVILDGQPATMAIGALQEYRSRYPTLPHRRGVELSPWQARVAFADNHDMPRLRHWLDDPFAAELAMTVIYTVDAIPSVYYGTEQELAGGWGNASREVLWEEGFREDTRMYRHLARLAEIRRESAALRRGKLVVRYASSVSAHTSAPGAGLLAWEREHAEERILVAMNGHPIDDAEADVPTGFAAGTALRDLLSGARLEVGEAGVVRLRVRPRGALILELAE